MASLVPPEPKWTQREDCHYGFQESSDAMDSQNGWLVTSPLGRAPGSFSFVFQCSNVLLAFLHLTSISSLSCPPSPSHLFLLSLIHSRDNNSLTCSLTKIAQLSELHGNWCHRNLWGEEWLREFSLGLECFMVLVISNSHPIPGSEVSGKHFYFL